MEIKKFPHALRDDALIWNLYSLDDSMEKYKRSQREEENEIKK